MINSYLHRSVAPIADMTMRTDKTTPRAITTPGPLRPVELGVISTEGLDFAVVTVVEVNYKEIKKTIYLEKINYFFLSAWAGGIQQILQSDWFRERAEFSHPARSRRAES